MKNWVLVANASRARLLEETGVDGGLAPVADFVHPQSRMKGSELERDRPGHVEGTGHGLGSASYTPRTGAREREHQRFARELAQALEHGVTDGHCAGLTLVASDPFLGELKARLGPGAKRSLLRTVPADCTGLDARALAARLHGH